MEPVNCRAALSWEEIYRDLRQRILAFDVLPGDVLSENTLAAQMNVSRAPVREAMARLVEEGYVVVYPQRGTVVSLISAENVRQSVFVRAVLEHSAVEALCRIRLSDEQCKQLEQSLVRQRALLEQQRIWEMLKEDDSMHRTLYEFSGHVYADDMFRMLNSDQMRVRYLQFQTFSYGQRVQLSPMMGWENCLVEHRMLLDALRKGDAEAACLIDTNHINSILWNTDNLQKIYPQYFSE